MNMKRIDKKTTTIAAATLVVGLLAGWVIFGGEKGNAHNAHEQEKTEIHNEMVWTCSMHPQIRQNEAGDCPICGMELIPLESEQNAASDPNALTMSPTAMQLASVSTAIVSKTNPVKLIRLNGKVEADERLVYSQPSHFSGRIEKLMVNFTGEYVNKGQTIANVYSPDLVTAQEELFEAKKMADSQPDLYMAAIEKLKNLKLTGNQIDEILNSGTALEAFPVQADVAGYVTSKMINLGDYVSKGEIIYEIADLSKLWVLFDVYESEVVWIKKGDKVDFTISSFPGESFTSKFVWIDPVINPQTRVAKARAEVDNSKGNLKPEMFASGLVEARLMNKSNSIVIPKTAVMWTGTRSVVYVKSHSPQGVQFTMRVVTLGPDLGDSYVIEEGLAEGEEIAVNGTFSIDAAAQLVGKPSMMNPEGGQVMATHNHGESTSTATTGEGQREKKALIVDEQAEEALKPLYTAYLNWKDYLVNDDFTEAQKMATHMNAALGKIDMSLFSGDDLNDWVGFRKDLSKSMEHIHHATTIEQLRKTFQAVSAIMIDITIRFTPLAKTLYVQHCPMADNNKGADWLSMEKEIRNPYFGSAMISCGEISKEIK